MVRTTLGAFVPVFGPLQMTDLIGHDTLRDISNALYPELAADQTASRTIEQHIADALYPDPLLTPSRPSRTC